MDKPSTLWQDWKYEFEAWISRLQSVPIRLMVSKDHSQPYEMERRHIFKLESGQYALITEDGCSCYETSDAKIELFPSYTKAVDAWNALIDEDNWNVRWTSEKILI